METVLRGLIDFLFLMIVMRLSGKRTLSEATPFDLVLLLIISETTQQAMVDNDHSMTNGALLILTLVMCDIALSYIRQYVPSLNPLLDGSAVILVRDGVADRKMMQRERVDVSDVLEAARELRGVENLDQIKLAVLERSGRISIVLEGGRLAG